MGLQDTEIPAALLTLVKELQEKFGLSRDDVFVADADHEGLEEGAYSIAIEGVEDWTYTHGCVAPGWQLSRLNHWCLAAYPLG